MSRRSAPRVLRGALGTLLALFLTAGPIRPDPAGDAAGPKSDRTAGGSSSAAPRLASADLAQVRKAVAERKGAPLLLNFWASWCEPCVEELPDLAKIETRFASSRIRVLGVASDLILDDDSPRLRKRIQETLEKAGVTYPNLVYTGSADPLLEAFDLPGSIPVSILFGPDGRVLRRWDGRLTLAQLERALGSPASRRGRT